MKFNFKLVLPAFIFISCQSTKDVYDDVYDAAEKPAIIDNTDGYADYVKDSKGEYKTVTTNSPVFGGYYNQSQSTGAAEQEECDCCESMRYRNFNHYRFMYSAYYPGSYFGSSFYRPMYGCDCCEDYSYYGSNDWFSFGYLGSAYSYYGFYDAWGNWHSYSPFGYSPWGYDPYGYYSYAYGWNNYGWNNNTNNNWWNNNSGNGTTTSTTGNHYYGHRGTVFSGSSNTSVYEHTVKLTPVEFNQSTVSNSTVINNDYVESSQFNSYNDKPIVDSKPVTVNTQNNIVSNQNSGLNNAVPLENNSLSNVQTSNNSVVTTSTSHVPAASPFVSKYNTGYSAVKNGGSATVTNSYSGYDPQRSNVTYTEPSQYQMYNSSENSGTTTSRSSGNERGSSYSGSGSNSGGGGTYEGHRNSGSSGNSGGSNTGGSSRTTSSSRR